MKLPKLFEKIRLAAAITLTGSALAQAKPSWAPGIPDPIMQPGVSAVTCAAQSIDVSGTPVLPANSFSFAMFDLRNPAASNYIALTSGANPWDAPLWHHPDWSVEKIGCVFGIAIDKDGDTYVGANGLWAPVWGGPFFGNPILQYGSIGRTGSNELGASGTIYKIDRLTGVPTVFVRVPQQPDPGLPFDEVGPSTSKGGPGLGNLTVHKATGNLFATSLDDGKIYQYSSTGTLLGTYDPFTPEGTPTGGMVPLGERLWAVQTYNDALYFSRWRGGFAGNQNEIYRVNLVGGVIDPTSQTLAFTVPVSYGANAFSSVVVSDIAFSSDGLTMLIGERCIESNYKVRNHTCAAREATFASGSWTLTGEVATGYTANPSSGEAYGGVDYGIENGLPEQVVWMTSADIVDNNGPHGMQGMRSSLFPAPMSPPTKVAQSYVVSYDPAVDPPAYDDTKGIGGDIEIMQEDDCATVEVTKIECPRTIGGAYTAMIKLTNLQSLNVVSYTTTPTPAASLPPSAIGIQPLPTGIQPISPAIGLNGMTTLALTLPGLMGGEEVCFNLTLFDERFRACCTVRVCIDIPKCDCGIVSDVKVTCLPSPAGSTLQCYNIMFNLTNSTNFGPMPFTATHVSFGPNSSSFTPNFITLSPALAPGGTTMISTTYKGMPGQLCFNIGLHSEGNEKCCFIENFCVTLPDCDDHPTDTLACCNITPERAFCCPLPSSDGTPLFGTMIRYTLCNKSTTEQTYTVKPLTSSMLISFTTPNAPPPGYTPVPATGLTLGPIPPGGCRSIDFVILCSPNMKPGECVDYVISAQQSPTHTPIRCEGTVCRPDGPITVKPVVVSGDEPKLVTAGTVTPARYTFSNSSNAAITVPYHLVSSYGAVGMSLVNLRSGVPFVSGQITVPARGSSELTVYLSGVANPQILLSPFVQITMTLGDLALDPLPTLIESVTFMSNASVPLRVRSISVEDSPSTGICVLSVEGTALPANVIVEEFNTLTNSWAQVPASLLPAMTMSLTPITVDTSNADLCVSREGKPKAILRVRSVN
jgi:hypothetical protein